jgi:hypothetical protein
LIDEAKEAATDSVTGDEPTAAQIEEIEYQCKIREEHIALTRVAVKVMGRSIANRDILVEHLSGMFSLDGLANIEKILDDLPFLLCPDRETLSEVVQIGFKILARQMNDKGINPEYTDMLLPLGEHVVDMYIRGDSQAYTPQEVFEICRNVATKAASDVEEAGRLLMGLARSLLGDRFVDSVLRKVRHTACMLAITAGEELMAAAGLSHSEVQLLRMVGACIVDLQMSELNQLEKQLQELPRSQDLLASVKKIAESILGQEIVEQLLASAIEALMEQLKDVLLASGLSMGYTELLIAVGVNAGQFIIREGVEPLEADLKGLSVQTDPLALVQGLLSLGKKILGAKLFEVLVSTHIVRPLTAQLASVLTKAGCNQGEISLLFTIGSKLAQYTPAKVSEVLAKFQELPAHSHRRDALVSAMTDIANDLLGPQLVSQLLGQAQQALFDKLTIELEKLGTPECYLKLATDMFANCGVYLMENGVQCLMDEMTTIFNTIEFGLDSVMKQLVRVCKTIVGQEEFGLLMHHVFDEVVKLTQRTVERAGVDACYSALISPCATQTLALSTGDQSVEQYIGILEEMKDILKPNVLKDPEKVMRALYTMAENVLGKEMVDRLLNVALTTAIQKLKNIVEAANAGSMYAELAANIGMAVGDYVLQNENAVSALQERVQKLSDTSGDLSQFTEELLEMCLEVLGEEKFRIIAGDILQRLTASSIAIVKTTSLPSKFIGLLEVAAAKAVQEAADAAIAACALSMSSSSLVRSSSRTSHETNTTSSFQALVDDLQKIPSLTSQPNELMAHVRAMAVRVLGEEQVNQLLDSAVNTTAQAVSGGFNFSAAQRYAIPVAIPDDDSQDENPVLPEDLCSLNNIANVALNDASERDAI